MNFSAGNRNIYQFNQLQSWQEIEISADGTPFAVSSEQQCSRTPMNRQGLLFYGRIC
jgi:hypothetical protein